jgi:WD40 repeat protein
MEAARWIFESPNHFRSVPLVDSMQSRQTIASGGFTGNILIRNVRTGKMVTRLREHPSLVASLVFTPDGKGLLSATFEVFIQEKLLGVKPTSGKPYHCSVIFVPSYFNIF